MENAKERLLPGTSATYIDQDGKGFSQIEMLISATKGLSLSQVCAVTGLEGSTIQNWVKRGWVAHPKGKKYEETHVARILIINALKECIKLEHISMLMSYVNSLEEDGSGSIIKESELFSYLCDALQMIGKADNLSSHGGVEAVAERVLRDYETQAEEAKEKIRKALTLMIYACVCTDVKRRTESMMRQILRELKVERSEKMAEKSTERVVLRTAPTGTEKPSQPRKTVSQALREWDRNNEEATADEEGGNEQPAAGDIPVQQQDDTALKRLESLVEASAAKPVYFRKG